VGQGPGGHRRLCHRVTGRGRRARRPRNRRVPLDQGFVHFQFSDYAKLTVVGVLIACAAWPIVARVSSAPRWLFLRLAVLVTLVLLLPDV